MKIAVFDVCGTIYDANTTFDFLDYYFKDNDKYNNFTKLRKVFLVKVSNYIFYKYFKKDITRLIATSFLKNEPIEKVQKSAKQYVNNILSNKIKKQTINLMKTYKNKGFHIILMSGSYNVLIEHIQAYFDTDDYFASKLEIKNSKYTGKYKYDQLLNKKDTLQEYYPNIDELIVVSDNRTDYELMKFATKSYAICNKEKQKKFWETKKLSNNELLVLFNV